MLKNILNLNGLSFYRTDMCTFVSTCASSFKDRYIAITKKSSRFSLLCFLFAISSTVTAGETICDSNGGAGYPINDFGITNLSIPFNFGDVSILHDINVETDITHTWVGDLTVRVTSPESATQTTMFERPETIEPEFTTPSNDFGCGADNIDAIFDDESANPRVENEACAGNPVYSGDYKSHDPAPNDLATYDGENPNGNWGVYLSDSANFDTGTLNEVCLTVEFAGVVFDKWVSTNPTCSDTVDSLNVAPGTNVYFCYTVSNPSSETFTINPGNTSDSQGHDLSALETTYIPAASQTVIDGPLLAGTTIPVGTTVNDASVTTSFSTVNFTGDLTTTEQATLIVTDPILNTSTKSVVDLNGGSAEPGDVLQYTITINETAGILTPNIRVLDTVDANLQSITFTTLPVGSTNNTIANNIDITGITLPSGGTSTIVYEATIALSTLPGTNINNTATISHAPSSVIFDAISPTVIVSAPVLSTSTKTVLDVNGSPALAGDVIRYTITINETGGNAATNITLSDNVDSNLTNVTIVSTLPVGAIDNTIGNNINISNITVAANSSQTIEFTANIIGSASAGTIINNTATIIDIPSGVIASPISGIIIVGATPTSGIKQLYFDNANSNPAVLTRVAPTNTRTNPDLTPGTSHISNQVPFSQAFTINGGSDITVQLWLRRLPNNSGSRTAKVEIFNGGTGASLGSSTQTWNVNGMQLITFTIPIAAAQNFAIGDFVQAVLTNEPVSAGNIRMRTLRSGINSQVQMDTSTVINVDSVGVFAAAFPSTTQFPSYVPGSTVFIRADVSDPFGNADITSSNITITDSSANLQVNNAAMTSVATPTGATRVYEFSYTIPATPEGVWSVSITANEGAEGTVSHNVTIPMVVGSTAIQITKTSNVISDPVNLTNPKAIPDAIVEYTITVENSGFGFADTNSINITDPLPTNTTLFFGSPLNPATFIDGGVSSGLTFNFASLASTTDDIAFSNNGGSTFITPNVDVSGFDVTVPAINYISINPKGAFNGSADGVSAPSFEIRFRIKVE